jgi:hypothetical protein
MFIAMFTKQKTHWDSCFPYPLNRRPAGVEYNEVKCKYQEMESWRIYQRLVGFLKPTLVQEASKVKIRVIP